MLKYSSEWGVLIIAHGFAVCIQNVTAGKEDERMLHPMVAERYQDDYKVRAPGRLPTAGEEGRFECV